MCNVLSSLKTLKTFAECVSQNDDVMRQCKRPYTCVHIVPFCYFILIYINQVCVYNMSIYYVISPLHHAVNKLSLFKAKQIITVGANVNASYTSYHTSTVSRKCVYV